MKKILMFMLCVSLLLTCSAYADDSTNTESNGLTKDLVILFTGDVHGGTDKGWTYTGLYGIKSQQEKNNYVLLVDTGDSIQGEKASAVSKGGFNINLMNAMGYDLAVPGVHEFDYGTERFFELADEADFEYISSNFTCDGNLVFNPYVIREFDGVKVAFVGISSPQTINLSNSTYFNDEDGNCSYCFYAGEKGKEFYSAVQEAVNDAKEEGADYVIALAHLGSEKDTSPYMSTELIANTSGIDAVLGGYSHAIIEQQEVKNKEGETVLLCECGTNLEAVGCCTITKGGDISTKLFTWDQDTDAVSFMGLENEFTDIVNAQNEILNEVLDETVATSSVELIIRDPETGARVIRNCETNLGDFVADAYREATKADVAIVSAGSICCRIPAGDITVNDLIKCCGEDSRICMAEVTGQQILNALEWASRQAPKELGDFLQVSGITYEIHEYMESSCKSHTDGTFKSISGEYRIKNVKIGGEDLELKKTYTLAADAGLIKESKNGFNMFENCNLILDETMYGYEALIDYAVLYLEGDLSEYLNIFGDERICLIDKNPETPEAEIEENEEALPIKEVEIVSKDSCETDENAENTDGINAEACNAEKEDAYFIV